MHCPMNEIMMPNISELFIKWVDLFHWRFPRFKRYLSYTIGLKICPYLKLIKDLVLVGKKVGGLDSH